MARATTAVLSVVLAVVLAVVVAACGDGGAASPSPAAAPPSVVAPSAQASTTRASAEPSDDGMSVLERARAAREARASEAARASQAVRDPDDGWALTATVAEVVVRDAPDGEETHRLANPNGTGAPLTFLLARDGAATGEPGWYEVHLPVRPNGSTGWVAADDVDVARLPYRLLMDVQANELTLLEEGRAVRVMPAASGTGDTPTPRGLFFLTELLVPTNAGYGPYAYGLSGYSEVLTSFGGGPGQIGLHGTDDASSVGRAVSHGCIRLSDDDITFLAETLPLGTPIEIA